MYGIKIQTQPASILLLNTHTPITNSPANMDFKLAKTTPLLVDNDVEGCALAPLFRLPAAVLALTFSKMCSTNLFLLALVCRAFYAYVIEVHTKTPNETRFVTVVSFAAQNVRILKWAFSCGCPKSVKILEVAAGFGHLDVVQFALDNGCDIDVTTCCTAAARNGHVHFLEWAFDRDMELFEDFAGLVCDSAAKAGRLNVLKFTLAKGFYMDDKTRRISALAGHADVIKWLKTVPFPSLHDEIYGHQRNMT